MHRYAPVFCTLCRGRAYDENDRVMPMKCRRKGRGGYMASMAVGVLIAMLLPVWWCFWIICALIVLICLC